MYAVWFTVQILSYELCSYKETQSGVKVDVTSVFKGYKHKIAASMVPRVPARFHSMSSTDINRDSC